MYKRNYDLINAKFREFLIPTLFTSMAGNISIFIDSILVSILIGVINLSVMQIIEPVSTLLNLLYWMIGLGGSLVCFMAKAEFDNKKSDGLFTSSIVSMIIIGVLITLICLLFSDNILHVLCSSDSLRPLVSQFFKYYIIGIPFLCYMMSLSYFIRADGFLKLPFISLVISNASNLVLDVVFIYYMNLGLEGAALATMTSYIIGSVCMSTYFFRKSKTLNLIRISVSSLIKYLKDICKSGYSTASTQLYLTIKLYVINMILLGISGAIGLAAFNMCYNSLYLISIFIIGIAQSMSPIVSVYYKEKDFLGVDYVTGKSLKLMILVSLVFVAVLTIYPQILLLLFKVDNPEHIPYIMNSVRVYSLNFLALGINFLFIFYAQAIQKDKIANIVQILEGLIFPLLSLVILVFALGDLGIWLSFFASEVAVLLCIIGYSRYVNRKTNGKYHGLFINKSSDEKNFIDFTINANIEEAVGLSNEINKYLGDNADSTRVSLAVEEILTNIIRLNKSLGTIDLYLKDTDEEIILSIKDDGVEYNPIVESEDLKFDNISVLNKISDNIDYTRVLGLNSTIITIIKNNN